MCPRKVKIPGAGFMTASGQGRQRVDQLRIFEIARRANPYLDPDATLLEDKPPQPAGDGEAAEDAIGMMEQDASGGSADRGTEIATQGTLCPSFQLP